MLDISKMTDSSFTDLSILSSSIIDFDAIYNSGTANAIGMADSSACAVLQ
jgi:hypothetical protein